MTQAEARLRSVLGRVLQQPVRHLPADAGRGAGLLRRRDGLLRADPARGRRDRVQGPRDATRRPAAAIWRWSSRARPRTSRSSSWTRRSTGTCAACSTRRSRRAPSRRSGTPSIELDRPVPRPRPIRTTSTSSRTSPGPFPVEVITRMAGVPEEYRQQVRHLDRHLAAPRARPDRRWARPACRPTSRPAMYYYGLVQERRANPQDDMISRLIAAEIPDDDGNMRQLDDIEICGFATLLGGAGAETVTKLVGTAMVNFARFPEQWQKLLDDRSKIPGRGRGTAALRGPGAVQRALHPEGRDAARRDDPRRQAGVPDRRRRPTGIREHSPTLRSSTSTATAPRRRTSAWATASTAAWVLRWPGWKAPSRWNACWTSCRATRCSGTVWNGSTCRTSRAGTHVPVKVLR